VVGLSLPPRKRSNRVLVWDVNDAEDLIWTALINSAIDFLLHDDQTSAVEKMCGMLKMWGWLLMRDMYVYMQRRTAQD
jgi:hypothetical protein